MTESPEALAAMLQTLSHHELAVETPSPRPILITEQEVVLATMAAVQAAVGQTVPPSMETRPQCTTHRGRVTSSAPGCHAR